MPITHYDDQDGNYYTATHNGKNLGQFQSNEAAQQAINSVAYPNLQQSPTIALDPKYDNPQVALQTLKNLDFSGSSKEFSHGFQRMTGGAGFAAMTPWYNKQTGQEWTAPSSAFQNPDSNWVTGSLPENWTPPAQPAQPTQPSIGQNIMAPPTPPTSVQQPIDTRYEGILGQAGQEVNNPTLPAAGVQQPIQIGQIPSQELRTAPLVEAPQQATTTPIDPTQFSTPVPTEQAPAQVSGATAREITEVAPVTQAVLGQINTEDLIGDVTGQLSSGALAQAQTEALDEKATVRFQLGELYKSLDEGTQLPAWAAPNARKVDQLMLQRGLGASSMAAAARTQALMESALPIAAADADKYSAIQLQNLNNKQTAALQNAAETAAMDRANLDVRMRSAQQNATSFLQMNMANVTNEQATNNLNHQSRMQELFSDVASLNAARNFNATSQNQVDQFYATLGNQVQQANEAREAAVQQFNVQTDSAQQQFNSTLKQNRNKFNAEMQNLIDSSNTSWRRQITTYNNQLANQAQQTNARNLLGISESRQNQLWQAYRDEAVWANQSFENEEHRQQALTLASLAFNRSLELSDRQSDDNTNQLIGAFGTRFLDNIMN